jgi:fatty acid desaturase
VNPRRKAAAATASAAATTVIGATLIAALYGFGAAALAVLLAITVVGLLAFAEHQADTAERQDDDARWTAALTEAITDTTHRAYAAGFRDGAR